MTLFRKNYKEAMDDIKPDTAFVESVIAASKKRRPPLRARYMKYAAAIAAAVVVVSGTVLSMPLWNKVQNNSDGVISEVTSTATAAPKAPAMETSAPAMSAAASTPQPTPAPATAATEKPKTSSASGGAGETKSSSSQANPSTNNTPTVASGSIFERNRSTQVSNIPKSESQVNNSSQSEPQVNNTSKAEPQPTNPVITPTEAPRVEDRQKTPESNAQSSDNTEVQIMRSIVKDDSEEEKKENKEPSDMAPYKAQEDVSYSVAASNSEIADTDIPTPTGYSCTSATPRGYTFVNSKGAVITVSINYGGEERDPYIEENGDNIYAVFTSYGLSVTINASGADRSSVEEIINSLR